MQTHLFPPKPPPQDDMGGNSRPIRRFIMTSFHLILEKHLLRVDSISAKPQILPPNRALLGGKGGNCVKIAFSFPPKSLANSLPGGNETIPASPPDIDTHLRPWYYIHDDITLISQQHHSWIPGSPPKKRLRAAARDKKEKGESYERHEHH